MKQGSTNGVSNVVDTRTVTGYTGNSTGLFIFKQNYLKELISFANSTGLAESGICSTYDVSFLVKDIDSISRKEIIQFYMVKEIQMNSQDLIMFLQSSKLS